MLRTGRGTAMDVGTKFWDIVEKSGERLAVFDHDRFAHIVSGAQVQFCDEDGNGIAEHVQSAADLAPVMSLAVGDGQRFGWGARQLLGAYVVKALSDGRDVAGDIAPRHVAVRQGVGADGVVTLTLLKGQGFTLH